MREKLETEDIVGKQIGIYQVMYLCDHRDKYGHRLFHVKCTVCGHEFDRKLIKIERSKKCEHVNRFGYIIDGKFLWKNQRIGSIFMGMKNRCYVKTEKDYRWYGAKGIKIYDEWLKNPGSFEEWSLNHGYNDNLTIDRIDGNKDYCPENCRWVTNEINAKYKSTTHEFKVGEFSHTGREWGEILGLGANTVNMMLRNYNEEIVKEFIIRRIEKPNLKRKSRQTWMNVYGLE